MDRAMMARRYLAILPVLALSACGLTGSTSSPAPLANFTCSMDRPGIGGTFTLTTTNPGTSAFYVGTVHVNFSDAAGTLTDH